MFSFGPGKTLGAFRNAMQLVLPLFASAEATAETQQRHNPPKSRNRHAEGVHRQALVGGETIPYVFKRRPRKSIGFTIDQRGLIVSAPRWVTMSEVDEAVVEKSDWINRKLLEWEAFEQRRARLDTAWEHGGIIRYLGQAVRLAVVRPIREHIRSGEPVSWRVGEASIWV